jgi:hypothetical protein
MLYIIAGASLTGKTTIRHSLTRQLSISGIDTDTLRTMANELTPPLNVSHLNTCNENYIRMRPVIQAFIHARSFFPEEDYILEGDAINLASIQSLRTIIPLRCVVLGYPHSSIEQKLTQLQQASTHWSHEYQTDDLRAKISEFIRFSEFLENEANQSHHPYIDVSSLRLNEVVAAAIHKLLDQP